MTPRSARVSTCGISPAGEGRVAPAGGGWGAFGYDPIFLVPAYGKTMAQLPLAVKNRISHRARAFAAARPFIKKLAVRTRDAVD